jgi:hypothetical protein
MITTVKPVGAFPDNPGYDLFVNTKLNQPETVITMEVLAGPDPVYNLDTGLIEDYTPGSADVTIHIKGDKFPSNKEFSMAFHDFLHNNQLQWSPDVEQDMLWEVCRATEI